VAPISQSLIHRMTGRADSGIRRSLKALESEGVLIKAAEPTYTTPTLWKLNKDYERWGRWSVESVTVVADMSATTVAQEECHHDGTIEEKRDLRIHTSSRRVDGLHTEQDLSATIQSVLAFAANYAKEHFKVALTERQMGHLAAEVKRQFDAGADPLLIRKRSKSS